MNFGTACKIDGIYLHGTPVLALLVSWFGHKDHVTLVGFSVLVPPTRASIVVVVGVVVGVGHIGHLVDVLRPYSVIRRPLLGVQGLSVCTREWCRSSRRTSTLRLALVPAAVPGGVVRWPAGMLGVETARSVQHHLVGVPLIVIPLLLVTTPWLPFTIPWPFSL